MSIHYKGIMTIIPPVVTTVFIALFWRRFDAFSAVLAMVVGGTATVLTGIFPEPVMYLREFFMGAPSGDPIYFRAVFGAVLTTTIGVVTCLCRSSTKEEREETKGLTADTLEAAMYFFKGGKPNLEPGEKVKKLRLSLDAQMERGEIKLSGEVCDRLKAKTGDRVYVSDNRWWLGGIRSGHFVLKEVHDQDKDMLFLSEDSVKRAYMILNKKVFVEKII